jgi:hypothetical protein
MNNYITMNTLRGLQGGGAVTGVGSPAGFSDFNSYALGGY